MCNLRGPASTFGLQSFALIATALLNDEMTPCPLARHQLSRVSDGEQILEAMVAADLLAYRPLSGVKLLICSTCLKILPKLTADQLAQETRSQTALPC